MPVQRYMLTQVLLSARGCRVKSRARMVAFVGLGALVFLPAFIFLSCGSAAAQEERAPQRRSSGQEQRGPSTQREQSGISAPGHRAPQAANGPQSVSLHDDWEVAYLTESGARVCYAFTRRFTSDGAPQGRTRPVMTVTHRPSSRDQIAFLSGLTFAAGSEVQLEVGTARFSLYTAGGSAFARDGRAVATAFQREREAVVRTPVGAGRGAVTDRASLKGFSAAYQALDRCAAAR